MAAQDPGRLPGTVLLSLANQPANTLLHDGHRWRTLTPARIADEARDAVRAAGRRRAGLLVHASFAFLRAVEDGQVPGEHIAPIAEAALAAERLVLESGVPACVVRLGYLYGPRSTDLRAYRLAFRIGRPYWAGPARRQHHFVHVEDAARAMVLAARRARPGRVYYATDDTPASFGAFMDHFARGVGNPLPLHLPALSGPVSRLVVGVQHMEMVRLGVHGDARPRVPGFRPRYPSYRSGLRAVLEAWSG